MKIKKAIEVLEQHKSTAEKFKMTVGTDKISEAINTVIEALEKPNICTCGSKNYGYGFAKCYDCGKIKEETK